MHQVADVKIVTRGPDGERQPTLRIRVFRELQDSYRLAIVSGTVNVPGQWPVAHQVLVGTRGNQNCVYPFS